MRPGTTSLVVTLVLSFPYPFSSPHTTTTTIVILLLLFRTLNISIHNPLVNQQQRFLRGGILWRPAVRLTPSVIGCLDDSLIVPGEEIVNIDPSAGGRMWLRRRPAVNRLNLLKRKGLQWEGEAEAGVAVYGHCYDGGGLDVGVHLHRSETWFEGESESQSLAHNGSSAWSEVYPF
ncbi:hypothetical protein HPP92_005285 [Vanilla planifolia]|uniref:Uncharacterized protein n=1 Tax=Vanilla planifolia TaxID=51239 RepID=A0A835VAV0_VANPL|nr:hypothetical protein HPP92_005285 [Vanilla planifolia]